MDTYSGLTYGNYQPDNQPYFQPTFLQKNNSKHQAAHNQAAVARADYEDYKRRFMPIENELIGMLGNRAVYGQNVDRAVDATQQAFDTTAGEYQRGLWRYGIRPSQQQQADQDRKMGLASTAAQAEAANRVRMQTKDRNMRIMGGNLAPKKPGMENQ